MIPKVIHYCWFGHNPKPKLAEKCIKSWKKHCPDYQIIEWNEDNYDILSAPLYLRQAYEAKKWAFVTDYVRLDVVYKYGGLYFDTDVEMVKSCSELLQYDAFFGFEDNEQIATGLGFGAIKNNNLIELLLDDYQKISFFCEDGKEDHTPCPTRNKHVFEGYGFLMNGQKQLIDKILVLSQEYFCPLELGSHHPKCTKNTYTIHWYSGSWASVDMRKLFRKDYLEIKKHNTIHAITHLPNRILRTILGEEKYSRLKKFKSDDTKV